MQLVVFHLKGDFLSIFVLILIIFNQSLWVLLYTVKLWNAHFWTTLGCSFTCYQRKFNLLKSSLAICLLKIIKMYRKLDRKPPFTYAATWRSITSENSNITGVYNCNFPCVVFIRGHVWLPTVLVAVEQPTISQM